jgi:hypothetical protein
VDRDACRFAVPQEEDGRAGRARTASSRHRKRRLGGTGVAKWTGMPVASPCALLVQKPTFHATGNGHHLTRHVA